MKIRLTLGGAALVALVAVACADTPTDPAAGVQFDLSTMYGKGATGAMLDPGDLAQYDDGNGIVCVKTVPEGKGKAAQRTIVKDDKDGVCPGGFEVTELGSSLPLCEGGEETLTPDDPPCDCQIGEGWQQPVPFPGVPYFCGAG